MTSHRKNLLNNDEYYHIFNRSIAKYIVFNNEFEYLRFLDLLNILRFCNFDYHFSQFQRLKIDEQKMIIDNLKFKNNTYVDIIAYCIMPTHFHLILKQNINFGITKYISKLLNSYSKFFNQTHKRSGPLWSSRFKNVKVTDDDQLLHLTRYIHLNPCSSGLTNRPEYWKYSSYNEYLGKTDSDICKFKNVISVDVDKYKKFVNDRKDYQQKISQIKNLLIDNYSG